MSQFDLKKHDIAHHKKLHTALIQADNAVIAALDIYNAAVRDAFAKLQPIIESYNAEMETAQQFRDGLVEGWRDVFDNRSDKWRESDAGTEIESFISEWENVTLDLIEVEEPEELVIETSDHDAFGNLPDEAPA